MIGKSPVEIALVSAILAYCSWAFSDTVHLKSGKTIENAEVRISGNIVHIRTGTATVQMPVDRIDRIEEAELFDPSTPAILRKPSALGERIAEILPTAEENRFLEIPWRPSLLKARAEAASTGKPIFLWAMNGHPMALV